MYDPKPTKKEIDQAVKEMYDEWTQKHGAFVHIHKGNAETSVTIPLGKYKLKYVKPRKKQR